MTVGISGRDWKPYLLREYTDRFLIFLRRWRRCRTYLGRGSNREKKERDQQEK
jgi:hypothetical protein